MLICKESILSIVCEGESERERERARERERERERKRFMFFLSGREREREIQVFSIRVNAGKHRKCGQAHTYFLSEGNAGKHRKSRRLCLLQTSALIFVFF